MAVRVPDQVQVLDLDPVLDRAAEAETTNFVHLPRYENSPEQTHELLSKAWAAAEGGRVLGRLVALRSHKRNSPNEAAWCRYQKGPASPPS